MASLAAISAPSTNVIGRNEELAIVAAFLDGLPEGPAALIFSGAPGAGKTTLWIAGMAAARAHGSTVLVARPVESETTLSFAALGDLLGGLVAEVDAGLPPPQARALDIALLRVDPGEVLPDSRAVSLAVLAMLRSPRPGSPPTAFSLLAPPSGDGSGSTVRRCSSLGGSPISTTSKC